MHNAGDEEFLWLGGDHFGDWLATDSEEDSYQGATPFDYIASAYFAYSITADKKPEKTLGYDMEEYGKLYENIVSAFRERFTEKRYSRAADTDRICFGDLL